MVFITSGSALIVIASGTPLPKMNTPAWLANLAFHTFFIIHILCK